MKYYQLVSIILLFPLLGCNPNKGSKKQLLSTENSSSQINTYDYSNKQSKDKDLLITIDDTTTPNNIKEKINDSFSQSYDLYYIPVPSVNLQANIDTIIKNLHLSEWITKLPDEISPLGVNTSNSSSHITLSRLLLSTFNPINLNLQNKSDPRISLKIANRIYSNRQLIRTDKNSKIQKTFSHWSFTDSDITKMNNIPQINPLSYGGNIHILFLQVITIKTISNAGRPASSGTQNSHSLDTEYYINPININSLESIHYTVE